VQWEMFTDAEAVSNLGWATHSTAAPHTTADTYRIATANSGASTVSPDCPSDR